MDYYLYLVVYDLREKYGNSYNGRYNDRKALEKVFKGMNDNGLELCRINTKFQDLVEGMHALLETAEAAGISAGSGPEARALIEKIRDIHKDWDGIHMARSCWVVISDMPTSIDFINFIKDSLYDGDKKIIYPDDRLIVTQTELGYMDFHPDIRREIEDWLISKGHNNLI